MGLFRSDRYTKPGPGIPKGEARKKGFPRFCEILGRDNSIIMLVSVLGFLSYLPAWLLYYFGNYQASAGSATGFYLCYALMILYGAILGPSYTASLHAVSSCLRDAPEFFWHEWRKCFKGSFRQTAVAGMVYTALTAMQMLALESFLGAPTEFSFGFLVALLLSFLLFHMIAPYYFLQAGYLESGPLLLLRNSIFLAFGRLLRTLGGTLVSLVLFGVIYFLQPLSLAFALVLGIGVIYLWQLMFIWPVVDEAFSIEQTIRERQAKLVEDIEPIDFHDPVVNHEE